MNFNKAVYDYLDGETDREELSKAFYWLSEKMVKHFGYDKIVERKRDDAIQECVMRCWEVLPRYNRQLGIAWNFFSTTVLCLIRQLYRTKANYAELKHRYCAEKEKYGTKTL